MNWEWTPEGKELIGLALAGQKGAELSIKQIKLYDIGDNLLKTVEPIGEKTINCSSVFSNYYLYENDVNGYVERIDFLNYRGVVIQRATGISFAKTDKMTLNITKVDKVV